MSELLIFSTSASTRADRRHALLAAPHQHDALDDVVVIVLAGDAEPRLVADRDTVATSRITHRHAVGWR